MSKKSNMETKVKIEQTVMERMKRAQGIQPTWHTMCDQDVLHYVQALANSIGCPEEHFFFPLLSITAALVSTRASVHITESWHEPAVLWFAVLAKQGEMKSPAMNILLKGLSEFEKRNVKDQDMQHEDQEMANVSIDDIPSLVLDERNYSHSTVRDILASHNNRMLMMAKDLSFLCKPSSDKTNPADIQERERKHVLSSIYNGNDPDFSVVMDEPMCLNVTGFFNPKQALSMMNHEDIDPVISHILFSCPLERDCFMEDLDPVPKYLPPLSLVFSIIHEANKRRLQYQFNKDALMMVNEYLNDLIMQKRAVPNDENRRYIFTKARAQFCRLALICHILRDAMKEAIERCEKNVESVHAQDVYAVNNQWRTSVISMEPVHQAREIMIYFIDQKLSLLPTYVATHMEEPAVQSKPERQQAPVSVPYKQHAQQWAAQQTKPPSPSMQPSMNVLQEMHNSAREFLNHMTSSRDLQNHFRAQQAVHTPQPRRSPAFPNMNMMNPLMQHINGYAQTKAALAAPSLVTAVPTTTPSTVPMPLMTPVSSTPINMVKHENVQPVMPVAVTPKPRNRPTGHVRKNPNPHPAHSRSPNYQPNMIKMCGRTPTIVGTEGENGTYNYDFSNLLPYASKNLRSLLTSGHHEISASIVAGRHLMPPTKTPGTENRYKTEAAVAYLQKVAEIGFGSIYRTNKKSTVFRKRSFDELSTDTRDILEKIQVTEQAYKRVKTTMVDGEKKPRANRLNNNIPVSMTSMNTSMAFMNSLNLSMNHHHHNNEMNNPLRVKEDPLRAKDEFENSMLSGGDISMDIDTSSEHSTSISNPPSIASNPPYITNNPSNIAISPPNIATDPVSMAASSHFTMIPLNLKCESPSMPAIKAST